MEPSPHGDSWRQITPSDVCLRNNWKTRTRSNVSIEDLFFEPEITDEQVANDYGVDWGGPYPEEVDGDETVMPDVACPLNAQQLRSFKELINPLDEWQYVFGIDICLSAIDFCTNHHQWTDNCNRFITDCIGVATIINLETIYFVDLL